MRLTHALLGLACCLPALPARADLDCPAARTDVDRAICATPSLLAIDRDMQHHYDLATSASTPDREELLHQQLAWLRRRNDQCGGDPLTALGLKPPPEPAEWRTACLLDIYRKRLRAFGAKDAGDPICHAIVRHMAEPGTTTEKPGAEALQIWSKGFVRLDAARSNTITHADTLTMRSKFAGTAICQSYTLTEAHAGAVHEINPPPGLEGGIEGNCGVYFQLIEVDNHPALMEESPDGWDFSFSRRLPQGWSPLCTITVVQHTILGLDRNTDPDIPPYFCKAPNCAMLDSFSSRAANIAMSGGGVKALWEAGPPTAYNDRWNKMAGAASQSLAAVNIPVSRKHPSMTKQFFDLQGTAQTLINNGDVSTAFVPVAAGRQLLLGVVGPSGFGCCREYDNELFGVFSFDGTRFTNIAGFEFNPSTYMFDFAQVSLRNAREIDSPPNPATPQFTLPARAPATETSP